MYVVKTEKLAKAVFRFIVVLYLPVRKPQKLLKLSHNFSYVV